MILGVAVGCLTRLQAKAYKQEGKHFLLGVGRDEKLELPMARPLRDAAVERQAAADSKRRFQERRAKKEEVAKRPATASPSDPEPPAP